MTKTVSVLGEGAYGTVHKICDNKNCYASKTFKDEDDDRYTYTEYVQEKTMLELVNQTLKGTQFHSFIVKPVSTKEKRTINTEFDSNTIGTLSKLKNIDLPQMKVFLIEIFGTLDYLYETRSILHMDLKSQNIIVVNRKEHLPERINFNYAEPFSVKLDKQPLQIKIIDWGIAIDLHNKLMVKESVFTEKKLSDCFIPFYDFTHIISELYMLGSKETKVFIKDLIKWVYSYSHEDEKIAVLKAKTLIKSKKCQKVKELSKKKIFHLIHFRDLFKARNERGPLFS